MNWILLSILSAVSVSFSKILQKMLLKDEKSDTIAFGFIFQLLIAGLFLFFTILTDSLEFPNLSSLSFNLILMAILYSLGNLSVFYAYKQAEASEVSIIYSSSTMWSVICAVLFLGERISVMNIIGIVSVVLGIITINYSKTSWHINKGHVFAALGAMLFGFAFTNDVYIIQKYHSIASYMILAFALPGFVTISYSPKSIMNVRHYFSKKTIHVLLLCCIFYALSSISIFMAYKSGGQASVISPIQQSSIIITVVLGYTFLRERSNMTNKIIGMILAFIGVLLLIT